MHCLTTRRDSQIAFFLLSFTVSVLGCRSRVIDSPANSTGLSVDIVDETDITTNPSNNNESDRPNTERSADSEPPRGFHADANEVAKIYEPVVVFSAEHDQTCLVKIGDDMPAVTFQDLESESHRLADFYGDRLTLIVFWNRKKVLGREQFSRLGAEIADEFAGSGLEVVAVNVGDSAEDVKQMAEEFDVSFPCLLDKNGVAFRDLATSKLPRTYLLDSAGKVVWFDIEYSRDMRRELRNAILYYLQRDRNAGSAG